MVQAEFSGPKPKPIPETDPEAEAEADPEADPKADPVSRADPKPAVLVHAVEHGRVSLSAWRTTGILSRLWT